MADRDISFGGHKAPRSSAEGARIEAPREVECGEGVSPSPLGVEFGEGAMPIPRKLFNVLLKTACYGQFWGGGYKFFKSFINNGVF